MTKPLSETNLKNREAELFEKDRDIWDREYRKKLERDRILDKKIEKREGSRSPRTPRSAARELLHEEKEIWNPKFHEERRRRAEINAMKPRPFEEVLITY